MIRPALESDLPAIRDLLVETWHATYDAIYGVKRVNAITGDWHSLPVLMARLERSGAIFLVAVEEGRIEAMIFCTTEGPEKAKLHQLYVAPTRQGKGHGSRLLAEVEGRLASATTLTFEVEEANKSARRFYERHGFAQAGATSNCGAENSGIPALVYEKWLT